jgi:DNA-binding CsgD family transcriptional regulator
LAESGDIKQATLEVDEVLTGLDDLDDAARAVCLLAAGGALQLGSSLDRGLHRSVPVLEDALACARRAGRTDAERSACALLATSLIVCGEFEAGESYAAEVLGFTGSRSRFIALSALEYAAWVRGHFDEARALLDGVFGGFNPRTQAQLEFVRMQLDMATGVDSGAAARLPELIDHARRRGFTSTVALLGSCPGMWRMLHGEPEAGAEDVIAWYVETRSPWSGFVLYALLTLGRVEEARAQLEADRGTYWGAEAGAMHATFDTVLTRLEGDVAAAEQVGHQALVAHHRGGFRREVVHTLEALAGLATQQGSYVECARLAGAAQALRDDMGYVLRWPYEERLLASDFAAARGAIGDDEFERAFADGRTLDEEAAVAYAERARGERKRPTTGWNSLTPTEESVVRLVASGLTNKEVGRELLMGAETVKTHLSHVFDKLGLRSRAALAAAFASKPSQRDGEPRRDLE